MPPAWWAKWSPSAYRTRTWDRPWSWSRRAPTGEALNADALLEAARSELPAYMVPRRIIAVDALPRNANGKPDRKGLATAYADTFRKEEA